MPTEIDQLRYDDEVETQADYLRDTAEEAVEDGEYDRFQSAAMDLVTYTLDGHEWFTSNQYGPADWGAIIEFADDDVQGSYPYGDLISLIESSDPIGVVRKVAYIMFEWAVIEYATAGHES